MARWKMVGLLLLTTAMTLSASGAPNDALARPRLESMLEYGDETWIVATFERHPGGVLPFFDGYLEEGLALIEAGGEIQAAHRLFRTAGQFAAIASYTFEEPLFATYAAHFPSWSPTEQERFRAGQRAYKAGRSAASPAEALPSFTESFRLAQPLGDAWGMAMAAAALARVHGELGDHDASWHYYGIAADLYGRMRMTDSLIAVHLTQAGFRADTDDAAVADRRVATFTRAWHIVRNRNEHPRRAEVADAYVAALRAKGETAQARVIEAEAARLHR